MPWLIAYLVVVAAIWVLVAHPALRWTLVALVTALAALGASYFAFVDPARHRPPPAQESPAPERPVGPERPARTLTPADVTVANLALAPGETVTLDATGARQTRPDYSVWRFSGEVGNGGDGAVLRSVTFRLRLFSCPAYFTTPPEAVTAALLNASCTPLGERSVSVYDLDLAPGASRPFAETVRFAAGVAPSNWRYWADIINVSAGPLP